MQKGADMISPKRRIIGSDHQAAFATATWLSISWLS